MKTQRCKAAKTQSKELVFASLPSLGASALNKSGCPLGSAPALSPNPEAEALDRLTALELPSDWCQTRLGDLFEIQQGKAVSQRTRDGDNQRPFLRTANVFWGRLDLATLDHMHFGPKEQQRLVLKPGDLLTCEGGDVGRTAIWRGELEQCFHQNHVHRLRTQRPDVEPEFYMRWMEEAITQLGLYAGAHNTTTIPNLSKNRVAGFAVPHPPLPEQRAIVSVLRTVQGAKEACEQVLAATRQLKQSLLHHLFTYGPVPLAHAAHIWQRELESGVFPSTWMVKRFDEFATLQRGQDLARWEFKSGTVPVIGATTIIGYHDTANVKGPGVTVVRSGSSAGKPLFIERDFWAHNVVLYVKDFHGNDTKFVFYMLGALGLTKFRTGVAVPTLNRNTFSGIQIAVPPLPDQREIAAQLAAVDAKLAAEESRRAALAVLFLSMLHHLMTGKVRLPEFAGHKT